MSVQQMGYNYMEIASSMRTMNRFNHSCVRFTMGVHPCLETLAWTMNKFCHSCVRFAMGFHPYLPTSQHSLQLMEVASVFSNLLYNHIMDRSNHSCMGSAMGVHPCPPASQPRIQLHLRPGT